MAPKRSLVLKQSNSPRFFPLDWYPKGPYYTLIKKHCPYPGPGIFQAKYAQGIAGGSDVAGSVSVLLLGQDILHDLALDKVFEKFLVGLRNLDEFEGHAGFLKHTTVHGDDP